ncbi:MAG: hypothetical protein KF908_05865 [Nitrosomonas sp.]|nr:hypothetical protein [Nitrosomonas sp.]MCW5606683.1 hypothetical protein [Nitrosomonas sp.]
MLRIIAGLLLLWTPYCGFTHSSHDAIQYESAVFSNSGSIAVQSAADAIDGNLRIDATRQPQQILTLLSTEIPPAHAMRLSWQPQQSLDGLHLSTPVLGCSWCSCRPGILFDRGYSW